MEGVNNWATPSSVPAVNSFVAPSFNLVDGFKLLGCWQLEKLVSDKKRTKRI